MSDDYTGFQPGESDTFEDKLTQFFEQVTTTLRHIDATLDRIAAQKTPVSPLADIPSADPAQARARAEYNRDHAAELYGDALQLVQDSDHVAHWIEASSGRAVVFTQYGWLIDTDSEDDAIHYID